MPSASRHPTTSKEYHREYYKKYKDMILYRRTQAKECKLTEDVLAWKANMLNNPHAFFPFYQPPKTGIKSPDISSCSK
jgi:hypothetical protein